MRHYVYKMLEYKHEMIAGDDLFLIPTKKYVNGNGFLYDHF